MDEQSIFLTALEKESIHEQAQWLDEACGADTQLRRRIESLLIRHRQPNSFLEKPVLAGMDATVDSQKNGDGLVAANQSVLKSLGQTNGAATCVVLRDPIEVNDDWIVMPSSPEVPVNDPNSRYQLQGELARGGMGAIIKGRDTDLGRDLAIKVLLDEHKHKPEVVQRFIEEAQIGGQLQHPGIAPLYELGQFPDRRPFFSMKLVKGETLSAILGDREQLMDDRAKLLGIFEQICQTMAYAHSRGVIHRDLKPSNIMVGAFGEVQVMDWGLAKVLSAGGVADEKKAHTKHKDVSVIQTRRSTGSKTASKFGSQTKMGSVMGTPAYMPPEQALGEIDRLDQRTDVFGLGAILCEILSGKPPYVGDDSEQLFRLASRGKLDDCFKRLESSRANPSLIAIAKQCLSPEPDDRPKNGAALTERITEYLESVETKLRETELVRAEQVVRTQEERKRRRVSLALAASIFVTVGLGCAWWVYTDKQRTARIAKSKNLVNEFMVESRLHQSLAEAMDAPTVRELEQKNIELQRAKASAEGAVKQSKLNSDTISLRQDSEQLVATLATQIDETGRKIIQYSADQALRNELESIRMNLRDTNLGERTDSTDDTLSDGSLASAPTIDFLSNAPFLYEQAFKRAGLSVTSLSVEDLAQRIKDSAIRETLVTAIDNWARSLPSKAELDFHISPPTTAEPAQLKQSDGDTKGTTRTKLREIANAVDSKGSRLRNLLCSGDLRTLKGLTDDDLKDQSTELICWLGAAFRKDHDFETSVRALRKAQIDAPDNFWLNYELGSSLSQIKDQELEGLG